MTDPRTRLTHLRNVKWHIMAERALEVREFIFLTEGPHLGQSGIGRASVWGLAEEATPDVSVRAKDSHST